MNDKTTHTGTCLCAAVRIGITPNDKKLGACHCGMCRKWGGGPFLSIHTEQDVVIEGADSVAIFESSQWAERGFCGRCGTHLFYRLKGNAHYALPVGLFDDLQWTLEEQIFIDEKPPYYDFANVTQNKTGAEVFAQYAPPE
jgi:hypothetical protein